MSLEKELELKITHLQKTVKEAQEILKQDPPTKNDLLKYANRIVPLIQPIEKARPTGKAKVESDLLTYIEIVTPLLLDANDTLSDLNTQLQLIKEGEKLTDAKNQTIKNHGNITSVPRHLEIKIPIFDGTYANYTDFITSFRIATDFPNVSKTQKFLLLKEHLGPRPKLLLTGLEPSDAAFDSSMAELERTYNIKSRIIDSLQDKLIDLPPAKDTAQSLRDTYMNIEAILRALEHQKVVVNENETIRKIVLRKFPERICDSITTTETLTLSVIRQKVNLIIGNKEDIESIVGQSSILGLAADRSNTQETTAFAIHTKEKAQEQISWRTNEKRSFPEEKRECIFCKKAHYSAKCRTYDTATKRRNALPPRSCFACLQPGHSSKYCRNRHPCFYCGKNSHHPAFCPDEFGKFEKIDETTSTSSNEQKSSQLKPSSSFETKKETTSSNTDEKRHVTLALNERGTHLTARTTIRNPVTGESISIRTLLDCGSDSTYIHETHARNLRLTTIDRKNLAVTVFLRDRVETVSANAVHLELKSDLDSRFNLDILADTVPTMPFVETYDVNEFRVDFPQYAHRTFADPANHEQVGLILGNDYLWHLLKTVNKIQVTESLFLLNSVFGWLIVGRVPKNKVRNSKSVSYLSIQDSITSLWSLESLGIREPNYTVEKEEELALLQFYENIKYDKEEKRYYVTWPWRTTPPQLPNNFALAKGRTLSLFKKYKSEPKYITAVDEIFQQQIQSGIIEQIPNAAPGNNTHYLPFHLIINETKSTPVRIVYDGSARTKRTNNSINDCLYKGINLLADMIAILLRFRSNPIAVVADVEKAFHQVTLQEQERDYLRFLWVDKHCRDEGQIQIETYRFRRVPFGIISSPFILAAVITFLLKENKTASTDIILENLYVDNLITAVPDLNAARTLYENAINTFEQASMNIRAWTSNNQEFIDGIQERLRDNNKNISVLGLHWERTTDTFTIPVPSAPLKETKATMREILKLSAKTYDPLGWMAPVTVRSKLILQKMHHKKYTWDQPLTSEEIESWSEIYCDLQKLATIKIPRYFGCHKTGESSIQYHCFSDASKHIYAAAIYLRIDNEIKVTTQLLIAKARVAPFSKKDTLTIPRLELMGAIIAARLLSSVRNALKLKEGNAAILWTDSKCLLHWLHTRNTLPTFVKNRVQEIKNTPNLKFRYVPSAQNIADLPSRTCTTQELNTNNTWWKGPVWLVENEENWPIQITPSLTQVQNIETPHLKQENIVLAIASCEESTPFEIKPGNFNSYTRLVRITTYCVRFVRLIAKCKIFPDAEVTSFQYAKMLWIKKAQENAYSTVTANLKQSRIKPLSIVKKLRLFIDPDGIIRCAGRFQNAPIDENSKYPILLPKPSEDNFTFLLVLHHHEALKHAGTNSTLTKIRDNYWFPCGKQQTYHVITKCRPCAREMAKPYRQPEESVLPNFRLTITEPPFTFVGIDLCGPFNIQNTKKYVLVVTCLVTRGVSFEDVENLETHHIYAALRRIIARRASPKFYVSDNMKQLILLRNHIQATTHEQVKWKLLPQYSPWMGGVYERLIKILKTSFYRSLRESPFCGPVQFRTLIAEIEAAVNSRPLTYVDSEVGSTPLTPNHFLRVNYPTNLKEEPVPSSSSAATITLRNISSTINEMLTQFWNIWRTQYLQFLRERPAAGHFQNKNTVKFPAVNDVVIVHEKHLKRAEWKLGKIISLIPSEDKQIRAASVRMSNGNVKIKPLCELYFLELNDPNPAEDEEEYELDSVEVIEEQ